MLCASALGTRADETNSVMNPISHSALTGEVGPNLIVNGSFELPAYDFGYWVVYAGQGIGGWTVDDGTVEVIHRYWPAALGDQSLDLSGIFSQAGTISQSVSSTPGQSYLLRFAMAGNPEDGAIKEMKVYWEDRELADLTYNTAGQSLTNLSWRYHSYFVTARTNSSSVKFQSLTFNFLGPALDDVSLIPYSPPPLEVNLNAVLTLVGDPGATYRIEYSTTPDNPAAWQTLCEIKIPLSEPRILLGDPTPGTTPRRFYRSVFVSGQ